MADNPFDLPDFVCKIQLWLNLVDADRLRNAVIKKRLLTDSSVIERLRRTLRLHGPTAHNEELVQLLRAGGLAAYRELSDAVKELGYSTKSVEMLSVLPEQHAPEDTAQAMVLAVSPRPTSSTPVLAETQPTSSPPVRETQPPANDEHVHAEHAPPESTADVPSGNRSLTLSTPDVPAEPAGETRRAAHGIPARLLLLSLLAGVIGTLVMLSSTAVVDPDSNIPPSVRRCRNLLQAHYPRFRDTLDTSMLPEGKVPTVENVYVNLVMLNKNELESGFDARNEFASSFDLWRVEHTFLREATEANVVSLESLAMNNTTDAPEQAAAGQATQSAITHGTLIIASAGCGKSFVFAKVAPMKWAVGALWNRTTLVIARELRYQDVHKATGPSQLLGFDGIGIEDSQDRAEILDYINQHPDRLLLILDGLDEVDTSDVSSFVQGVIDGHQLAGIQLMITSRPCRALFALASLPHFKSHVELVGFQPDDVAKYVRKVLPPDNATLLIAEVEKSSYLHGMMATPFIAREVCVQFHHGNPAPQCVADLFEQMVVQVLGRRSRENFKHWSSVPRELQKLALEMGAFAFKMLVGKRLIFTDADLQRHDLSKDAIGLGLLVTGKESLSRSAVRQYRFSHLTVQEHLAALYQAQHRPMTNAVIVLLVESLGAETAPLRTFWVMLCAQVEAVHAECLVNSLLTRRKTREWQSGADNGVVSVPMVGSCAEDGGKDVVQLPDMTAFHQRGYRETLYLQTLAYQMFVEYAVHQRVTEPSLQSVHSLLVSFEKLEILGIHYPAEYRSIDTVLQVYADSVRNVSVQFWAASRVGQFPTALARCCSVERLSAVRVHAADAHPAIVSAIKCSAPSLRTLFIKDCSGWVDGIIPIVPACQQLEFLAFLASNLTSDDGAALAKALLATTTLRVLNVHENPGLGDDAVTRLCTALRSSVHMTKVSFAACGLTGWSLSAIATAVRHWPHLTHLDLRLNDFSEVTARQADEFLAAVNSKANLFGCYFRDGLDSDTSSTASAKPAFIKLVSQQSYTRCSVTYDGSELANIYFIL
eukprot:scpid27588/ scgid5495/ Nucleotide-binding oligomerization domain-containing protein 2; Caspase recruitment domain-containing protein 15